MRKQDATNKSTAEGKDAAQCYETARAGIREYSKTGFTDLENCSNDALSYISHDEVNIHSTILVSSKCHTPNELQWNYFNNVFFYFRLPNKF